MREIIDLNNGWYYKAEYHEGMEQQDDIKRIYPSRSAPYQH